MLYEVITKTMGFLFDNFFQWGILAVIIMFQPELRRALEKMGRARMKGLNFFSFSFDSSEDIRIGRASPERMA